MVDPVPGRPEGGTMSDLPYTLVKYVHVLAAMVWVGGVFYSQVLARARRHAPTIPASCRGPRGRSAPSGSSCSCRRRSSCSSPASSSCSTRWQFSALWVSLGMATWLILVLIGALYLGPERREGRQAVRDRGPDVRGRPRGPGQDLPRDAAAARPARVRGVPDGRQAVAGSGVPLGAGLLGDASGRCGASPSGA